MVEAHDRGTHRKRLGNRQRTVIVQRWMNERGSGCHTFEDFIARQSTGEFQSAVDSLGPRAP
jgi:hypothetical protein